MKVNINQKVRVKFTQFGINLIKLHHFAITVDDDGYSEVQLHYLMYCFGRFLFNSNVLPFETTIEILNKY